MPVEFWIGMVSSAVLGGLTIPLVAVVLAMLGMIKPFQIRIWKIWTFKRLW
jgi:hypothetical protein